MAGNIKGITIEFRGDTTRLDKAIRQVNKETRGLDSELKKINTALKFNPGNVDLWRQKQEVLKQKISETGDKLNLLKQQQKSMDASGVDKNSAEYRELQREIIETESKLKTFKGQLKEIGNVNLRAVGEQLKMVGDKAVGAGKSLTRHLTAPITAIGAASVKVGIDFDSAMSQVAATMGTTTDQIQELRDFAKEMGATTQFSATEAAEGLNYMALAGYDAEQSMNMLPTVLNLAAAGNMDLAKASDMVTDAQSALGLSMDETEAMVDQMAKTASTTNTSVEQLGEAYLTVGGTAKVLRGGTEELSAVLGLLADNGVKGSEGGTALRNILLSLSAPTDKAANQLDALGVSVFDAEGNMRSMEDVFGDLNAALASMTDEEKTQAISNIFNKRDLKSVNALLGTSADRWEEVSGAISDADGAAAQMADTQLDNLQGSLTFLKSSLEGAAIAISDVLAPWIRKLADWIQSLIARFNSLSPQAQKVVVVIGAIAAAIGPLLVVIGTLISSVGKIKTILPKIGALFNPVTLAIAAAIAIGVLLWKNWDTIKAKAIQIWTAIKNFFVQTWESIKGTATKVWNGVKTAVVTPINAVQSFLSSAVSRIKSIWNGITSIPGKVAQTFQSVKQKITAPIESAKNTISNAVQKIKGFFPFNLGKILKLKIPHIKVSGGKAPWGIAGKGKLPSFSVNWYKTGGVFDSPSVIGVGEAGTEAVIPLDKLFSQMDRMTDRINGGTNVTYNITVDGAKDPAQFAEELVRSLRMQMRTA